MEEAAKDFADFASKFNLPPDPETIIQLPVDDSEEEGEEMILDELTG